ncbi:MAG: tRNA epoxyqueuosine(34) reductase QueG [Alphaproteobacteria bacterium]|nr:tRNA epoxyqueuosine(34) reductase QueG [Alphaproteobacteria bacterium]
MTQPGREDITRRAMAEGFDCVGITRADAIPEAADRLHRFLALGRHGSMGWMETRAGERASPLALWPEARSAILLGANYAPARDPLALLDERGRGSISVYARGADYHDVLKKALKRFGRWLGEESGAPLKVFVDTAPLMEKPLAAAAGLGWQGKHTNLVSREFGSWLFLGVILTALDLPADAPEEDHCGSCRACLDICPTGAFPAPYELDARRCISYLTIEHDGPIPEAFRAAMGNRIYGCDDCLAVCPWNKFAQTSRQMAFRPRIELEAPELADLAALDEAAFRSVFAGSPIKRIGRDRFVRNVAIAIGNSGDPALLPAIEALLSDRSPLVRGAAVWALGRLDPARFSACRAALAPAETDALVSDEWQRPGSGPP